MSSLSRHLGNATCLAASHVARVVRSEEGPKRDSPSGNGGEMRPLDDEGVIYPPHVRLQGTTLHKKKMVTQPTSSQSTTLHNDTIMPVIR